MRNFWKLLIGAGLFILGPIVQLLRWLGDLDFVIERTRDPSWLGEVVNIFLLPTNTQALVVTILVMVIGVAFLYWSHQSGPELAFDEEFERQRISPELIEQVQTHYNAWLKPAGDAANDVLRRVLFAMQDNTDASARIDPGLLQKSIIDVERAALSKLNNVLTGLESVSDFDQLQDCIVNYYREYQGTRTWIAKCGESVGFLFHSDPICQAWLHLDEKFLDALRNFSGAPRYERLRNGIESVGWGENVSHSLKRLTESNSPALM